jgi:hypothetical protein
MLDARNQDLQDLIAHRVAVCIVDFLEMIDVDHDQGIWQLFFNTCLKLFFRRIHKIAPVARACQRVGESRFFKLPNHGNRVVDFAQIAYKGNHKAFAVNNDMPEIHFARDLRL